MSVDDTTRMQAALFLPLLDLDETLAQLATIRDQLDQMGAQPIVCRETWQQLRHTRQRWADRLQAQADQLATRTEEQP